MTTGPVASTTLYSDEHVFTTTRRCIEAWDTGDLERTLATYTDDVIYRDAKIRGRLHGRADLRRYLTKFFAVWDVKFSVTDERRIAGENAQLCMWDCRFTHRVTGRSVTLPGMDLCEVRGDQLCRDEAFMDTLPLEGIKAIGR